MLRSAVDRIAAPGSPRDRSLLVLDVSLALVIGVGLLVANTRSPAASLGSAAATVRFLGTVVAAAAVATRRLDAGWSLAAATIGSAAVGVLGGVPMVAVCIALTAYTAATVGEYALWSAPPAAACLVMATAVAIGQVASWLAALIASVAVVCVGWFAGQAARERRNRLLVAAQQQAERERQRDADVRQAAVDERLVIARELHDIVSHAMCVIAVRAGVARMVMDQDPAEVKETLGIIETSTRQAMHEMQLLVEVLRHEDPAGAVLTPAPGLADVAALAEQIRLAGVDLRVDVSGPSRPLPPGVDLSAYRIAQEALTNVVRHAGPTHATLRIEYRAEEVLIDVVDGGPAAAGGARTKQLDPAQRTSARHGLIGMSERVALFDGELRTGRHGDGFQVSAVLRTDEPSE